MIPPRRIKIDRGPLPGQRRLKVFRSLRRTGFWARIEAPFRFADAVLKPWLKARWSLRGLRRTLRPSVPRNGSCVAIVAHYGNDAIVDSFLRHHRRLGVKDFVFLDLSTAGSLASHLAAQEGCSVWRPHDPGRTQSAPLWLNGLRDRHARGRWCLSLDSSDALVFYRYEHRKLADFTDFLESESRDHAYAMLIELYGEQPAAELAQDARSPAEKLDLFDAFGYVTLDPGRFRNVIVRGGLQRRAAYKTRPRQSPALNRIPLVKWQWDCRYVAGTRLIMPAHLNNPHTPWHSTPTACVLRYALLHDQATLETAGRFESAVSVRDGGLASYPGLVGLRTAELVGNASRRLASSRDLVEAGLLNPGQWF